MAGPTLLRPACPVQDLVALVSLSGHLCKSAAKFSITPRAHQANIKPTSAKPSHHSSSKQKNEFYWLDNRATLSPANPHKRSARPRRQAANARHIETLGFFTSFSTFFSPVDLMESGAEIRFVASSLREPREAGEATPTVATAEILRAGLDRRRNFKLRVKTTNRPSGHCKLRSLCKGFRHRVSDISMT